ncbi:MAG: hypothetical protein ACYDGR_00790 [Candidatus Dormibacteria bacterium]
MAMKSGNPEFILNSGSPRTSIQVQASSAKYHLTLVPGEAGAVTLLSLAIGTAVGVGMSMMFVQILTPLFTVPPPGPTLPLAPPGLLAVLVLAATAMSSLVAGSALRRTRDHSPFCRGGWRRRWGGRGRRRGRWRGRCRGRWAR